MSIPRTPGLMTGGQDLSHHRFTLSIECDREHFDGIWTIRWPGSFSSLVFSKCSQLSNNSRLALRSWLPEINPGVLKMPTAFDGWSGLMTGVQDLSHHRFTSFIECDREHFDDTWIIQWPETFSSLVFLKCSELSINPWLPLGSWLPCINPGVLWMLTVFDEQNKVMFKMFLATGQSRCPRNAYSFRWMIRINDLWLEIFSTSLYSILWTLWAFWGYLDYLVAKKIIIITSPRS